jgi:hypothetical protein
MSPGIALTLHWWRGIGPEVQANLFFYGFRLGFVTISVERESVLEAYRRIRRALAERIAKDEEGR